MPVPPCYNSVLTTPDYVINGLLPASEVSILAGASGVGKTTLLMQFIASAQAGCDCLGFQARDGLRIGYLFADRAMTSAEYWAKSAGVQLDKLKTRSLVDDTSISLDRLSKAPLRLLLDLLGSMLPADLLVVDPLVVFLGTDIKAYNQNAAQLILLNRWAKEHNVTILGTHHAAKARTDYGFKRPQDRISGSSALLGYTSTQLFLDSPEETDGLCYTFHVVPHNAVAQHIPLQRNEATGLFEPVELGIAAAIHGRVPLETVGHASRQQLLDQLPAVAPRTLDYHLHQLVETGALVRSARGRYSRKPSSES